MLKDSRGRRAPKRSVEDMDKQLEAFKAWLRYLHFRLRHHSLNQRERNVQCASSQAKWDTASRYLRTRRLPRIRDAARVIER